MPIEIRRTLRWPLFALTVLVSAAAAAALTDQKIGVADKVVGQVYGESLLRNLRVGEDLLANQHVRTGDESAADLEFMDESHLVVGARTEVLLDEFVFDPNQNTAQGIINILRGVLRFTSSASALDVTVKTRTATIGIRGTIFDVLETSTFTEIAVHEGTVQVDSPNGSVAVSEGEVLTLSAAGGLPISNESSPGMQAAVSGMLALVGDGESGSEETRSGGAESATAYRDATLGRDLENLLVLETRTGRVVIEMRPDLAPRHVARIKELTRALFYDDLTFHSVIPGLAAQTGDPSGSGAGGSGTTLAAEFSDVTFRRGSVGMRHERGAPDTGDSQFFIILQDAPRFDGQYTFWGQVIYGMEFIDQLRPGHPPRNPDKIIRMRVAADLVG